MSRSVRLFELANMRAGRRPRSMRDIVANLEVSERTACRDLTELGRLVPLARENEGYRLLRARPSRLRASVSPLVTTPGPDALITVQSPPLEAPPSSQSIDVRLFTTKVEPTGTLAVRFDDAWILQPLFADGFETGDALEWDLAVPP